MNTQTENLVDASLAAINKLSAENERLKTILREIAGMAETGRETVNACVTEVIQLEVDAAASVTRGWFMTIERKAKAAV